MTARISTDDAPPKTRFDYARHVTGEAFVPFDIRTEEDAASHRAQMLIGDLGEAWVTRLSTSSGEAHRTPELIRQSDVEVYKLEIQMSGKVIGVQDDREAVLDRGDLAIYDMTRPYASGQYPRTPLCAQPYQLLGLMIPRTLLPLSPDDVARLTATRLSGRRGIGRLVSQVVRQLATDLDDYDPADAASAATAALDLLTTALAGQLDRANQVPEQTRRNALLARVHAFIEHQLADPALSPSMVAAAHHVSLRYLQKLFQAQGTSVAAWIRDRRLERCRRDLLDPAARSRPVSAVATRWGLPDPAYFNRAFRAAYGMPPGDYRQLYLP